MNIGLRMRVRLLASVLGSAIVIVAPPAAEGAPIVSEQFISNPLGTVDLTASFVFDSDVALFHLAFGPGSFTLTGQSTSALDGFDPIMLLFDEDGAPVPYPTSDGGESISPSIADPDIDVLLPLYTLAGGVTYTLAVTQFGPFTGNFPVGNLADGFDHQDEPCFTFADQGLDPAVGCVAGAPELFGGQSGTLTLSLSITSDQTAPVPEPGTLTLMVVGSIGTALVRRHNRRRRTTSQL